MIHRLYVVGDPILDQYYLGHMEGEKFVVEEFDTRQGGAANTYQNACSIAKETDIIVRPDYHCPAPITLSRYVDIKTKKILFRTWNKTPPMCKNTYWSHQGVWSSPIDASKSALVIADYNKGLVSSARAIPGRRHEHKFAFVVVDSKYRSTDATWISEGKTKIWRCTGEEYDPEWAKQFDWIVWTDGAGEIHIFTGDNEYGLTDTENEASIPVPTIKCVDSCGAGDTFTAALATWLCQNLDPDDEIKIGQLEQASKFAITCAQNVCAKPFTSVTDIKLRG